MDKPDPDTQQLTTDALLPLQIHPTLAQGDPVILIGASTGGTEAIKAILTKMPAHCPGILIAQHLPAPFTHAFVERLDEICAIRVSEAASGMSIQAGHAYIAPANAHLMLKRMGTGYQCDLLLGPPVNRHRPSVDILFRSAANVAGAHAIGIMLTGMGKDGARGMWEMKQAGAYNIAQDETTSVVYGMPKEAALLGGVDEIVPLQEIAVRIMALLHHKKTEIPTA